MEALAQAMGFGVDDNVRVAALSSASAQRRPGLLQLFQCACYARLGVGRM